MAPGGAGDRVTETSEKVTAGSGPGGEGASYAQARGEPCRPEEQRMQDGARVSVSPAGLGLRPAAGRVGERERRSGSEAPTRQDRLGFVLRGRRSRRNCLRSCKEPPSLQGGEGLGEQGDPSDGHGGRERLGGGCSGHSGDMS